MSDDLLDRMTKALREEAGKEPSPERSSLVRARVLSQTKRRAQLRPQGMWQWAAVVCLGFFVSTAMAHVIRVQLPRVIEAFRDEPAAPAPPKAAAKRPAVDCRAGRLCSTRSASWARSTAPNASNDCRADCHSITAPSGFPVA